MRKLGRLMLILLLLSSCATREKSIRNTHFEVSDVTAHTDAFHTVEVKGDRIVLRTITYFDTSREDHPITAIVQERDSIIVHAEVRDTVCVEKHEEKVSVSKEEKTTKSKNGHLFVCLICLIIVIVGTVLFFASRSLSNR